MCGLSDNIYDYHYVSQGKTTIPSMDDGEEMAAADVRFKQLNEMKYKIARLTIQRTTEKESNL